LMGRVREGWMKLVHAAAPLPSPPLQGEGAGGFIDGTLTALAKVLSGRCSSLQNAKRRRPLWS
jgi:hypothetical protein